jgi:tetratricopeptide (TPR) repeat protein
VDAERLALETGDPMAIGLTRWIRAASERWIGNPRKTLELTQGLVEQLRNALNPSYVSGLIFLRGVALAETGRIEEGIALLKEGIDLGEKLGSTLNLGRLYNCLGYCYGEIHLPGRGLDLNKTGEALGRQLREAYPMGGETAAEVIAQGRANLMENSFDQGDIDTVLPLMKSIEDEARHVDYDRTRERWEVRVIYLGARISLLRGDLLQAEALTQKNLEMTRQHHHKKLEGASLRLLGEIQIRRGETDLAFQNLREAVAILQDVGNPRHLWQAHASLASAFDQMGRGSEARDQWGAASNVIHGVADNLSDPELRTGFLEAEPVREILAKAGG